MCTFRACRSLPIIGLVLGVLSLVPSINAQNPTEPPSQPEHHDGKLEPIQIVEAPGARVALDHNSPGRQDFLTYRYRIGGCTTNPKRPPREMEQTSFSPPINVATAAGGKMHRIVVNDWMGPSWSDIAREVQRVWAGQFSSVNYAWAEANIMNLSATIEFENSEERGCLVTDGAHVFLRDVKGRNWSFRLLPAAQ
jgi:hypothetical protein